MSSRKYGPEQSGILMSHCVIGHKEDSWFTNISPMTDNILRVLPIT